MILHVDMDAFYAAVEELDRPELAGRPVIVGGDPDRRGVVAAANYRAREYGIHSAMPAAHAKRRCPQAVFLPPRFDRYANVATQIRRIFTSYTPLVEPLSLDEAFLDVRGSLRLFGPATEIGRRIKNDIHSELRLVASVGVAPNKIVAKIASDLEKPDGFVVVEADQVQSFLDPLPIGRLWGVGQVAHRRFERLGVRTIGQMRALSVEVLREQFGNAGESLWRLARGIDRRRVVPEQAAKSISHETTFAVDISDREILRTWLLDLTQQVARRLRRRGLRARTVHVKIRFADFRTATCARTMSEPTDLTEPLWHVARDLLDGRLGAGTVPLRLLGMGVGGLERAGDVQQTLFEEDARHKLRELDAATDRIRDRFGEGAVGHAVTLGQAGKRRLSPKTDKPPGR